MKKIKLILKGILLYMTILAIVLFIVSVENLYNNGWFMHSFMVCVLLCYACYKCISDDELHILTFMDFLDDK